MAWVLKGKGFSSLVPLLEEGVNAALHYTVANAEERAKELVPSPDNPGPFATGALQASIHTVTPGNSDYDEAIFAAISAPDTQILERHQIQPPILLPPSPPGVMQALLVAPLTYAARIEKGFFLNQGFYFKGKYHPVRKGGHFVAAQPFIRPAIEAEAVTFRLMMIRALKGVTNRGAYRVTATKSAGLLEWEARQKELAAYKRASNADNRRAISRRAEAIRARTAASDRNRQKGAVKGVRNGKAVRYYETFGEAAERLRNEFEGME